MFNAALINNPFGDPGVYVELKYRHAAVLFDLGDLHLLAPRKILKITHIFVSHTHMDHFIGFDHLLRLCLGRDRHIHLFGPPGIHEQVEHKLMAYTWNLVENYANNFTLLVTEAGPERITSRRYCCRTAFVPERIEDRANSKGLLVDDRLFSVKSCFLDHRIPCLAFRLEGKTRVNIMKNALQEMGLPVGAWLIDLKDHISRGDSAETPVRVWWRDPDRKMHEKLVPLGELQAKCVKITEGQKITYVTDAVWSQENASKVIELADGSDMLFIEAPFLNDEAENAAKKYHLTASQAGALARSARVKRMILFHFSPKYKEGGGELIMKEAAEAFRGQERAI